jgi:REP element-mobilizing transposase RayT
VWLLKHLPNRQSIRLPKFDYSSQGPYFVTIVQYQREPLFGHVTRDYSLELSNAGMMVIDTWNHLAHRYPGTLLDACVVMPDHFHGIITLGVTSRGEPVTNLATVMQWFKIMTGKRYGEGVASQQWPRYNRFLWQRSYYEHVIRNEADFREKAAYIESNPYRWAEARGFFD